MLQGHLKVPSPSGGGLGWGCAPRISKGAYKHEFTVTPAHDLKRKEELEDPAAETRPLPTRKTPGNIDFKAIEHMYVRHTHRFHLNGNERKKGFSTTSTSAHQD